VHKQVPKLVPSWVLNLVLMPVPTLTPWHLMLVLN
jgi:hypothetical protein